MSMGPFERMPREEMPREEMPRDEAPLERMPHEGTPLAATFDVVGPDDAPTIVFLHGTRLTRAMWRPQVPLADRYRLVMVDLPGHGRLASVRFTVPAASAHVSRVIDETARGRAVIVGQSLGGYVAMDVAARHPERVEALVLCNCTEEPRAIARTAPRVVGGYLVGAAAESWRRGRARRDPWRPPASTRAHESEGGVGGDQVDRNGVSAGTRGGDGRGEGGAVPGDPGQPGTRGSTTHVAAASGAEDPPLLRHYEPPTEGWLFKGGTRALFSALRMSFIPRLQAFDGPTLIINGAGDQTFRRGEQRFLAAAVNGRLVIIDGADHVTSEEAPETYNTVVRSFVEELGFG